jgi:hypothetical protein
VLFFVGFLTENRFILLHEMRGDQTTGRHIALKQGDSKYRRRVAAIGHSANGNHRLSTIRDRVCKRLISLHLVYFRTKSKNSIPSRITSLKCRTTRNSTVLAPGVFENRASALRADRLTPTDHRNDRPRSEMGSMGIIIAENRHRRQLASSPPLRPGIEYLTRLTVRRRICL